MPLNPPLDSQSTRPYLVRAIYEWCTDQNYTPYVAVHVDETVQVPREYVRNNEIVLNVSFEATSGLKLGNDYIEFKARFGGVSREIMVPMHRVLAIYALENGQGMAFPVTPQPVSVGPQGAASSGSKPSQRPHLTVAGAPPAPAAMSARVLQLVGNADVADGNDAKQTPHAEPVLATVSSSAPSNEALVPTNAPTSEDTPPDDDPSSPPSGSKPARRPALKVVK
jgi:stringent starvation protein B